MSTESQNLAATMKAASSEQSLVKTARRSRKHVQLEDEELAAKHFPYEPYYRTVLVEEPNPVAVEAPLEQRIAEAQLKQKQLYTQLGREHQREYEDARKDAELSQRLAELELTQPLLDDLDTLLVRRADAKQRVSEIRHQQWQRQVYNVIDKQVQRKLSKMTSEEIADRRRELFDEYLRITNYKRVVCDVVDPEEYNPLKYKSKTISVSTKNIQDPLRRELDSMAADDRAMGSLRLQKAGASSINATRAMVPTTDWHKVGDRHNRYCKDLGTVRQHPMSKSSIVFDHFNTGK